MLIEPAGSVHFLASFGQLHGRVIQTDVRKRFLSLALQQVYYTHMYTQTHTQDTHIYVLMFANLLVS
jgi:hypothetical protein